MTAPPVLTVDRISVAYANRRALSDVSLALSPGEVLVLLGPNGAGKSTLIKTISGRLSPSTGRVDIAGGDPARDPEARRRLGLVPQQIALFEKLSALENLYAFGRLMGLGRRAIGAATRQALADVGLIDRGHDRVSLLSGGMRRRVNIAAALLHGPSILVLDEPTAGVDYKAQAGLVQLVRSLKAKGLAILLTTHDMGEAEALADRVAVLVSGTIRAEGTPDMLIRDVFKSGRELTLKLKAGVLDAGDAVTAALVAAGLVRGSDGRTWSGIVQGRSEEFEDLLHTAMRRDLVEDVRVGRPGLDALLKRLVEGRPEPATKPSKAPIVASLEARP